MRNIVPGFTGYLAKIMLRKTGSIRRQFSIVFILVMAGMILLCVLADLLLLKPYYLSSKSGSLKNAYHRINRAAQQSEIQEDSFNVELQKICATYNIQLLILDEESRTVKASTSDVRQMAALLWNKILAVPEEGTSVEIIEVTNNYTLQIDNYIRAGIRNMVCWGTLDNGNLFLLESPVDSISESVRLSIRFMAIVGLIAAAIGAVIIYILTGRMTRPITKLSDVSEEMRSLHFDARYEGHAGNELDVLGGNLNDLSQTLKDKISELKTANNELTKDLARREEIDAERREFLSNVTHELKTPIALIQGYAEGLSEGIIDDAGSRQEYCSVIVDEAGKMNRLIQKLITLSNLESGENQISFQQFDIVELIRNTLRAEQILFEKAGALIRMESYPKIEVWADEFLVEEVFRNYLSNAIQHLDGERIIEVKLIEQPRKVRISVFNSGDPIPEESIPHIWDKFYKVDRARTRAYGGSGIGLSVVRAAMESMHQGYGVCNYDNGVEFWFELDTEDQSDP